MPYIAHRRYKGLDVFNRPVNVPYGSQIEEVITEGGNTLMFTDSSGTPHTLGYISSDVVYDHFSRNDDGHGFLRGKLTQNIKAALEFHPKIDTPQTWQTRWDLVWADTLCQKYKKQAIEDHWVWNYEFYNAPILDLQYIASLVGAKKGR